MTIQHVELKAGEDGEEQVSVVETRGLPAWDKDADLTVLSSANAPEIAFYEKSALFDRTVRFVGDEVAAVAADTEELAEDALRLIDVDYEPLPFVADLEAALQPEAPKL